MKSNLFRKYSLMGLSIIKRWWSCDHRVINMVIQNYETHSVESFLAWFIQVIVVDRISRILFPFAFFVFVMAFWKTVEGWEYFSISYDSVSFGGRCEILHLPLENIGGLLVAPSTIWYASCVFVWIPDSKTQTSCQLSFLENTKRTTTFCFVLSNDLDWFCGVTSDQYMKYMAFPETFRKHHGADHVTHKEVFTTTVSHAQHGSRQLGPRTFFAAKLGPGI